MADLLTFTASVELTAAGENGKAPQVTIVAYTGGPMRIPGWGPVVVDLKGLEASHQVPLLVDHDASLQGIVGHGEAAISNGQLLVVGSVPPINEAARQVVDRAKAGFKWQASVGVQPIRSERIEAGGAITVNGKTIKADSMGLSLIRAGKLKEVSLVALGADDQTSVAVAASQSKGKKMDNDTTIVETPDELKAAWDKPGLTDSQRVLARWNGAKFHDENIRQQTERFLHAALSGSVDFASFERELLKAELRDLKLLQMRAELPQPPAVYGSRHDVGDSVLEAAFCRTAGLRDLGKQFKPEVLEASDKLGGFGLQEMLLRAAFDAGYTGRQKITAANCRDVLKAAFSTHTITTMLSTAGSKMLLEGFNAIPQTWREVARTRSVNDFKEVTAYRLTADLEYEQVAPAGEIKHGTLGQESYTLQARTYAKMLTLTREDIINDDLGAFNDLRNRLGLGAAIKMSKLFWSTWLTARNAGTFWTSARKNLVTSAPLAEAGLNAAVKAFRTLTGTDGNMLAIEPDRLIVPADLEATARVLYASQEMRDTTASTKYPVANIFYGRLRPIIVPELGNSAYAGYSTTSWHLAADPRILASAEMCFLNGVESPTIESADADFNTLGIQFRGYHDFGMSMAEWRASVEAQA